MRQRKLTKKQLRAIFAKGRYYIVNDEISSQYLGSGETLKEAKEDYNDSLDQIFSNKKDREIHKI